jgi:hypothetical protein
VLAELAKGRLRRKLPALRQALHGRFGEHHALLIGLCLEHTAHLSRSVTFHRRPTTRLPTTRR